MNDKALSSALPRRLAAYSASVGVALVTTAADAQVVYTDLEPDVTFNRQAQGTFPLDFDGDGTTDLNFRGDFDYGSDFVDFTLQRPFPGGHPSNGALGFDGGYFKRAVSILSSGDAVGLVAPERDFKSPRWLARMNYGTFYPSYSPFANRDGYAGFRFVAGDGAFHYGWARIRVDVFPFVETLYEYAYEATPGATIVAGDTDSDIALAGTVNQTDFPADGGTLVFTATVTNTTGDDAPLDLWVEAGRNGFTRFRRRLGSGTVTAGATVTRTVAVEVFPGVPAGAYDVTFKIGDFAARAVLEAETFVVTKAASAEASAPVAEDLFGVEPVAGDLFAEASTAPSAAPATHALSAAMPNPSSGRAAFTLEVAETQAVRVAVYNALGQQVALLHDGVLAEGAPHRLVLEAEGLATGVYVVRAVGATFSDARTFTLTR